MLSLHHEELPHLYRFHCKVTSLGELRQRSSAEPEQVVVVAELFMDSARFQKFSSDLLMTVPEFEAWGGSDQNGRIRCVRVRSPNLDDPNILVNPEGYEYARYAAIEILE